MPIRHWQEYIHHHRHMQPITTETNTFSKSVCIKKWPQGDWINYFQLQGGLFGCQTFLSHTGETVILPCELNMTLNRFRHPNV